MFKYETKLSIKYMGYTVEQPDGDLSRLINPIGARTLKLFTYKRSQLEAISLDQPGGSLEIDVIQDFHGSPVS